MNLNSMAMTQEPIDWTYLPYFWPDFLGAKLGIYRHFFWPKNMVRTNVAPIGSRSPMESIHDPFFHGPISEAEEILSDDHCVYNSPI
jgi:hypothetical protein